MLILDLFIIWYIVTSVFFITVTVSNSFLYTKNGTVVNTKKGLTLVHLATSVILLFCPIITEKNSLSFYNDVILNNLYTSTYIVMLLLTACIAIGFSITQFNESNLPFAIFLIFVAFVSVLTVIVLLLFFIPINITECQCKDNYYGTNCEQTCYTEDNTVCNGHGTCNVGCECNDKFSGDMCTDCINKYDFETNCTTCRRGYSILQDCTACEDGKDKSNDCQTCISSYYVDPNNIFNIGSCTVCKPFYYKPSSSIERGSYNDFLQFGETCQPCKTNENGERCNGHGVCRHFWTQSLDGTVYDGLTNIPILGLDADGSCICDTGYAGGEAGVCELVPGYDNENSESICNGHGEPLTLYKQKENAIYSIFDKLVCKCDTNYYPSFTDSHTSCSQNMLDTTCIYGYWKDADGICQPCNGGGFLQGCNSGRAAGTCLSDGTCECYISYNQNAGGYTGDDCKTCANRNFYRVKKSKAYKDNPELFDDPEKCQPCPGAISEDIVDSCGVGYCITEILLDELHADTAKYDAFQLATGNIDAVAYHRENNIGTCICYETKTLNPISGICE